MLYAFLSILLFAPLCYGTTGPWAKLVIQGGVFTLLLWWSLAAMRGRRKVYQVPGGRAMIALALFFLLQLIPLPPALLGLLSPTAAGHYAESLWLISPGSWQPLSVDPWASLFETIQILSGLVMLFLTVQLVDSRDAQRKVLMTVVVFAGLYALIAILYKLFPNDRILWFFHPWPAVGQQFGTYVNGNHFAGLMGMLLPLCLAWFLIHKPVVSYSNWRERLVDFFSDPQSSPHLIYGMISLLVAISVFFSMSRGGILSCLGGLMAFGILLASRGVDRKRGILLISFFGLLLFGVGIFGWDPIFEDYQRLRNAEGQWVEGRQEYWQDAVELVADYPVFGTGFGSFNSSYRGYQSGYYGPRVVDHAHNDYVELITDGGLVGVGLVAWLVVCLVRAAWRGLRKRRTLMSNYLVLASFAGLSSMAFHSLTDFNLHIGANLIWFSVLWGLLLSAGYTRSRSGRTTSDLVVLERLPAKFGTVVSALLLVCFLVLQGGACLALLSFEPTKDVQLTELQDPDQIQTLLAASETAASRDRFNATYAFAVGNLHLKAGDSRAALQAYREAIAKKPLDGEFLQHTGLLLAGQGEGELGERLMKTAMVVDLPSAERRRVYGLWLLGQKRTVEGVALLREALAIEPQKTRQYLTLLILSGLSDRDLSGVLPDIAVSWLAYGDYLAGRQEADAAEQSYRSALALAAEEPHPAGVYRHVANYYGRQQRWDEAMQVLARGLKQVPGDASLHRMNGQFAQRVGLTMLARESYQQALLLNPRDKWVRKQLKAMGE